jgi:hypothetical protein
MVDMKEAATETKDSEYRTAFVMQVDVASYTMISCPEVAAMCRRVR